MEVLPTHIGPPASDGRGPGPLAGLRVVAVEQAVAAPLCSRHLADLGAEVIKIERPGTGDFARDYDAVVHGESAHFVWLNHGKRSVSLDLSTDAGRHALEALLDTADVFLHNLGPGALERLGFGPSDVRASRPRLITCEISGYGRAGPYAGHKAFDLLVQAESGLLAVTGTPEGEARVGISIADIGAGMYALTAILAALVERDRTGSGACLEIAMLDGLLEWMAVPTLFQRYAGAPPARRGVHHPSIAPYGSFLTKLGGAVVIAVQNDGQWRRFCERVLERPELTTDTRFVSNDRRVANRAGLEATISEVFGNLSREAVVGRLVAADIPFGDLNSVSQVLDHPQLTARERWITVATASGPAIVPRSPLGRGRPTVPELGADTAAILGTSDPAA